jgi:hypothetical protein
MILLSEIETIKSATFAGLVTVTEPKLRAGNPFPGIVKISRYNATLAANYQNSVNRQLGREDKAQDFVAENLPWGAWKVLPDGSTSRTVLENKGKFYLRLQVNSCRALYVHDGHIVSALAVKVWQYAKKAQAGLDKAVIVNSIAQENIRRITFNGKTIRA